MGDSLDDELLSCLLIRKPPLDLCDVLLHDPALYLTRLVRVLRQAFNRLLPLVVFAQRLRPECHLLEWEVESERSRHSFHFLRVHLRELALLDR